jgi:hypothetical protein
VERTVATIREVLDSGAHREAAPAGPVT